MQVFIETKDQNTFVKLIGRIDTANSSLFEKEVAPILTGEVKQVIVDCTELNYISSSGLRIFLAMQKALKEEKVRIRNMHPDLKEIFDITGFSPLFAFEL